MEQQHKRRVRYKGTHPRKFEEKYKEHNPEKYADTIEKVISKGSTPAGMHRSIMVDEILDFLQIQPGQKGLDATLGYGGHTRRMLERLQGQGHICALDVDPIEIVKTRERLERAGYGSQILTVLQENFADIDRIAAEHGPFDFILADLGVSSMQIDDPDRGFSYKVEGPLDLRLNPEKGVSAADRLKELTQDELAGMLVENADESFAAEIAAEVVRTLRRREPIQTTTQFKAVIERALSGLPDNSEKKDLVKKTCHRPVVFLFGSVQRPVHCLIQTLIRHRLEQIVDRFHLERVHRIFPVGCDKNDTAFAGKPLRRFQTVYAREH